MTSVCVCCVAFRRLYAHGRSGYQVLFWTPHLLLTVQYLYGTCAAVGVVSLTWIVDACSVRSRFTCLCRCH
jgi:hypothetical protein